MVKDTQIPGMCSGYGEMDLYTDIKDLDDDLCNNVKKGKYRT